MEKKNGKMYMYIQNYDQQFKSMCSRILLNGVSSEGEVVRAKWEDGTPAHTIKGFGITNRYDLRQDFPLCTLRPVPLKKAFDEILWIWQRKSNNIDDLNSHIWDAWADDQGEIGKAYGYQLKKKYWFKDITEEGLRNLYGNSFDRKVKVVDYEPLFPKNYFLYVKEPVVAVKEKFGDGIERYYMDQVDKVLYDLKNSPFSRRIMVSMYNYDDLSEMALHPCAYSMTFNVTKDVIDGKDRLVLNAILNQRSQDILTANAWNVSQYALLLMMFAQVSDMVPGELVHVIADAHIYDRHVDSITELLLRDPYPSATVTLNPEVKDFYQFTVDDLSITNYQHGKQIKIPVAV